MTVGDKLQPVLDGAEGFDRAADGFGRNLGETGGADGGENILDVVLALERNGFHLEDELRRGLLGGAEIDGALVDEGSLADDARSAEPEEPRFRAGCGARGDIVVGVQDECVVGTLIGEDALLGGDVIFHAAVAVEMVGRDVENHGNVGTELVGRLKLEAGDFEHRPAVVAGCRRPER